MKSVHEEIYNYFGGVRNLAEKLFISHQAVYAWRGIIPESRIWRIVNFSNNTFSYQQIIRANQRLRRKQR